MAAPNESSFGGITEVQQWAFDTPDTLSVYYHPARDLLLQLIKKCSAAGTTGPLFPLSCGCHRLSPRSLEEGKKKEDNAFSKTMNIFDRLPLWCDHDTKLPLVVGVMGTPQHLDQEASLHQCKVAGGTTQPLLFLLFFFFKRF